MSKQRTNWREIQIRSPSWCDGTRGALGAGHGYRNGIYEDEQDKMELNGEKGGGMMMMRKRASAWFEGLDDDQRKACL